MKITFDMDIAVISEAYKKSISDLTVIAQNLEYADTQYSTATSKEQNEWRDRCIAKLKAIDAFYRTDEILPEYEVSDWVSDVLGLSCYVGVVVRGGRYSCTLLSTPGCISRDSAYEELSRVFKLATGKIGWKLSRTLEGSEGMIVEIGKNVFPEEDKAAFWNEWFKKDSQLAPLIEEGDFDSDMAVIRPNDLEHIKAVCSGGGTPFESIEDFVDSLFYMKEEDRGDFWRVSDAWFVVDTNGYLVSEETVDGLIQYVLENSPVDIDPDDVLKRFNKALASKAASTDQ